MNTLYTHIAKGLEVLETRQRGVQWMGVQRMVGAGVPPPFPSAHPARINNAGQIPETQTNIASDYTWFPLLGVHYRGVQWEGGALDGGSII